MVVVIGRSETEWERWAMRRDHASWGAAGYMEKCSELKELRKKIVNDNYRTCNHGPSGARAIIVRKGGKATLVVH